MNMSADMGASSFPWEPRPSAWRMRARVGGQAFAFRLGLFPLGASMRLDERRPCCWRAARTAEEAALFHPDKRCGIVQGTRG